MSAPVYVTESGEQLHGIMAEFATPADLYHAAEKVRDAGYRKWDTFSPFPVHGMEEAMGVKRTILPFLVACGGFTGAGLGFLMQWWMASRDYQMVTQGKPFFSWQAFIPITFECGILFSAFTAIFGGPWRGSNCSLITGRAWRGSDCSLITGREGDGGEGGVGGPWRGSIITGREEDGGRLGEEGG